MKKRILTLCHENKIDAAIALLADLIQKNNAALACDLACLKKEWQSFQTALYLNLYTPQQVKGLIIEDVERILKKLSTTVEMPPPENKPHVQKETNTACKNTWNLYIEEFPENDFPRGMQFSIIALGVAGLIGYTIVVKTNYSLWVDGAKLLLGISLMMYSFWRWMTPYVQLKTHSLQIFQSPFKFTRLRFQEISSIVLPTQQPHIFELVTKTGDTHKIKSRMIKRKLRADFLNTMDDLRRSLIRA